METLFLLFFSLKVLLGALFFVCSVPKAVRSGCPVLGLVALCSVPKAARFSWVARPTTIGYGWPARPKSLSMFGLIARPNATGSDFEPDLDMSNFSFFFLFIFFFLLLNFFHTIKKK
jgi:hypothetical protein